MPDSIFATDSFTFESGVISKNDTHLCIDMALAVLAGLDLEDVDTAIKGSVSASLRSAISTLESIEQELMLVE